MNKDLLEKYNAVHSGNAAIYEQARGLIKVWGKEAIQFLNGLITNDVAKLEDGDSMRAAFPNAQGRLLALVRVRREGDAFLFETEGVTHEKVYNNLFRFTFAGDFFIEDLSSNYKFFSIFNNNDVEHQYLSFRAGAVTDVFVPLDSVDEFKTGLSNATELPHEVYEVLRLEYGIPQYGVDIDETTIVPEIGVPDVISYNKGCYIGQEIIARIYFRGHIAKQLKGLIFEAENSAAPGDELKSVEGKNAGRLTSVVFSPKLNKTIALAYVRYDYLTNGTELKSGDLSCFVNDLPFA